MFALMFAKRKHDIIYSHGDDRNSYEVSLKSLKVAAWEGRRKCPKIIKRIVRNRLALTFIDAKDFAENPQNSTIQFIAVSWSLFSDKISLRLRCAISLSKCYLMFSCNESEIYACVVLQLNAMRFKLRFVELTGRLAAFVQRKWNFRNAKISHPKLSRLLSVKACWWTQSKCRSFLWFGAKSIAKPLRPNDMREFYDSRCSVRNLQPALTLSIGFYSRKPENFP